MTQPLIDNPGATLEHQLHTRLVRMVKSIRVSAAGKTCGDCAYHMIDGCLRHDSVLTGNALRAEETAVACEQWEGR